MSYSMIAFLVKFLLCNRMITILCTAALNFSALFIDSAKSKILEGHQSMPWYSKKLHWIYKNILLKLTMPYNFGVFFKPSRMSAKLCWRTGTDFASRGNSCAQYSRTGFIKGCRTQYTYLVHSRALLHWQKKIEQNDFLDQMCRKKKICAIVSFLSNSDCGLWHLTHRKKKRLGPDFVKKNPSFGTLKKEFFLLSVVCRGTTQHRPLSSCKVHYIHLDSCQVRHDTSTYNVVRTTYDIVRKTNDVVLNIVRTYIVRTKSYIRCYIRHWTYDIVRLSTS